MKRIKVVINACFGGFCLSAEAEDLLEPQRPHYMELPCDFKGPMYRSDPALVSIVETLGSEKASGGVAKLKIVEIPDDVDNWYITDNDGIETIREGRTWR